MTFSDTLQVLQAEQVLIRHKLPFETVPQSHYNRKKCGLGILLSVEYLPKAHEFLQEAHIIVKVREAEAE